MSNWRAAAQKVLGGAGRFSEVSKTITSNNLPAETRIDSNAGTGSEVYPVYPVYNPPTHIKAISDKLLPIVEKYNEGKTHQYVDAGTDKQGAIKQPEKPNKPPKQVNAVSPVNSVWLNGDHPDHRIVAAIRCGDLSRISAVVASDPDLIERAAIREIDGAMSRADAEIASLHDLVEERGYAI